MGVPDPKLCGGRRPFCECGQRKPRDARCCASCLELEKWWRDISARRGDRHPAITWLRENGPQTAREIAGHVDLHWESVHQILHRAAKRGVVRRSDRTGNEIIWEAVRE